MEVSKACTLASLFTKVNTTQHTDLFLVSLFVCHSALRIAPNHHAIHLLLRYATVSEQQLRVRGRMSLQVYCILEKISYVYQQFAPKSWNWIPYHLNLKFFKLKLFFDLNFQQTFEIWNKSARLPAKTNILQSDRSIFKYSYSRVTSQNIQSSRLDLFQNILPNCQARRGPMCRAGDTNIFRRSQTKIQ